MSPTKYKIHIKYDLAVNLFIQDDYIIIWHVVATCPQQNIIHI